MKTTEEMRADYVVSMGDDLGRLYHELILEEDWLRNKWAIFQELFEQGQERIDLLNGTASNFFVFLYKVLFEDAILHLCRLSDKSVLMGKANLTLQRLPASIPDPKLKGSVEVAIEHLEKNCEFVRDVRNRHLAHADLRTARNEHPNPLPAITPSDIARALQCLRAVLSLIENHYRVPPALRLPDPWGARALVHCLQVAACAEDERKFWQRY